MKIGIDIRPLMDKQYSGVSEYLFNLLTALFNVDKKNKYKLFYNSGRDVSRKIPDFSSFQATTISTRYPNKIFNYLMQKILGWPRLDRLLKVDVFWLPHINFASFSRRSRQIITIHDLSFLRYPEFFSVRKNMWHKALAIKSRLKNFDRIVAVSENTKMDIVELAGISAEKIEVIYSGVNSELRPLKKDDPRIKQVRRKYNLPQKFILYLGTLEPRKNIAGLIKAFSDLVNKREAKDYCLVIAGGWGWKWQPIIRAWQKSPARERIIFTGYVNREDKVYLYNLASLFVYPSFYEGFGLPPLEAMACGCPVITSANSSLPEVTENAAVMIDADNRGQIVAAMAEILANQSWRQELSDRGRRQAAQFSWTKAASQYLKVFSSAYKEKKR
jgi:glycosyltransferase involved in cell wall biosynthesis